MRGLISVCDNLEDLPKTEEEMNGFDVQRLKWDPGSHAWFPSLDTPQGSEA